MKISKDVENIIVTLVASVAFIALASYLAAYFIFGWEISKNPAEWGPMGDYFGGVLNPIISLAALVALIRASKFQKSEFEATRTHLEREAKKNEIYRLITNLEKKIEEKLQVEVKNDRNQPIIVFGPLHQYLRPGWRPPPKTYISIGASSLCTPIKQYSAQILELITELEFLLNEYNLIDGTSESLVYRHLIAHYRNTKKACEEQAAA